MHQQAAEFLLGFSRDLEHGGFAIVTDGQQLRAVGHDRGAVRRNDDRTWALLSWRLVPSELLRNG
jgi:hypothetical protein